MTAKENPGRILTFYSYKGGVGRTMAMANVAALLASWGRRVLVVDFDLEAPGLQRFFEPIGIKGSRSTTPGVVDLIIAYGDHSPLQWKECLLQTKPVLKGQSVAILTAGQDTPDYIGRLQSVNWAKLLNEQNLGEYLHGMREEWRASFDFVLVDSRTGISDIGGICTIILPDVLVPMFTANSQSVDGVAEVMRRAKAAQELLAEERARLVVLPVLCREDRKTEYEQSEAWRRRIAETLRPFYEDWVRKDVTAEDVVRKLYLPQIPYWSFGERLPVIERPEEIEDPATLGAAYARLATLIDNGADWSAMESLASPHQLKEERAKAAKAEAEVAALKADASAAHVKRRRYNRLAAVVIMSVMTTGGNFIYLDYVKNSLVDTAEDALQPIEDRLDSLRRAVEKGVTEFISIDFPGESISYDFSDLNLDFASFEEANLAGSIFRNTRMFRTRFNSAILKNVDLTGAYLHEAFLKDADLRGAILVDANLTNADFRAADLRGADLTGAQFVDHEDRYLDFRGADLRSAKYDETALSEAFTDDLTLTKDMKLDGKQELEWRLRRVETYAKQLGQER